VRYVVEGGKGREWIGTSKAFIDKALPSERPQKPRNVIVHYFLINTTLDKEIERTN
jgi:hypothetical protein